MHVRDAVEADADALATLVEVPVEVMENVVHDRTVRVAEADGSGDDADSGGSGDADGDGDRDTDTAEIRGFVGFDADRETVSITHLRGPPSVQERLLDAPVEFARTVSMPVEMLVPEGNHDTQDVLEAADFEPIGLGPQFEGQQTLVFRREA